MSRQLIRSGALDRLGPCFHDEPKAYQASIDQNRAILLAALEEAKQFIQNGIEYGYINTPEDEDVLEVIKKAIRKAKGV